MREIILTWRQVNRIHRVRNGIYQRHARLVSLLTDFGRLNPCYPDQSLNEEPHGAERILYTGEGRHGDQQLSPGNRALVAAIESGHSAPLFNKLAPGKWQFLGTWHVRDGEYVYLESGQRMIWRFTLEKNSLNKFNLSLFYEGED